MDSAERALVDVEYVKASGITCVSIGRAMRGAKERMKPTFVMDNMAMLLTATFMVEAREEELRSYCGVSTSEGNL